MELILPREPIDPSIDAGSDICTRGSVEEVFDEETNLFFGHDARTHWPPQMFESEPRQLLGPRAFVQAASRLRSVEVDVTPLLLHDPLEQLPQRRMIRALSQAGIARLSCPLINGAPGHVQGNERLASESRRPDRTERRKDFLPPTATSKGSNARSSGCFSVGLEHLTDGLAVPHFFEGPAREE
jgi:hypothetical protein